MGMLLRRKLKALSENATTTKSLGMEPLPFSDDITEEPWNSNQHNKNEVDKEHHKKEPDNETKLSDTDIEFDEEPARRGRPRKSDM